MQGCLCCAPGKHVLICTPRKRILRDAFWLNSSDLLRPKRATTPGWINCVLPCQRVIRRQQQAGWVGRTDNGLEPDGSEWEERVSSCLFQTCVCDGSVRRYLPQCMYRGKIRQPDSHLPLQRGTTSPRASTTRSCKAHPRQPKSKSVTSYEKSPEIPH